MLKGQKLMILYTFILMIMGIILLICSLISLSANTNMRSLFSHQMIKPWDTFIFSAVIGTFMIVVGIFYCIFLHEDDCHLFMFQLFLVIIFLVELALFIFYFWYLNARPTTRAMKKAVFTCARSGVGCSDLDEIHQKFKCCGHSGPRDFKVIPQSCCSDMTKCGPFLGRKQTKGLVLNTRRYYYQDGCMRKLTNHELAFGITLCICSFASAVIAVFGLWLNLAIDY